MADWMGDVRHELSGHGGKKPEKKIDHIVHRKSHNGDHIFEHHHTHPEHHPVETHTKRGDDEMVAHMLQNAGTPNPGEDAVPAAGDDPSASPVQGAPPAQAQAAMPPAQAA